jgi:uncharacterized protein (DUF1778 family)
MPLVLVRIPNEAHPRVKAACALKGQTIAQFVAQAAVDHAASIVRRPPAEKSQGRVLRK